MAVVTLAFIKFTACDGMFKAKDLKAEIAITLSAALFNKNSTSLLDISLFPKICVLTMFLICSKLLLSILFSEDFIIASIL